MWFCNSAPSKFQGEEENEKKRERDNASHHKAAAGRFKTNPRCRVPLACGGHLHCCCAYPFSQATEKQRRNHRSRTTHFQRLPGGGGVRVCASTTAHDRRPPNASPVNVAIQTRRTQQPPHHTMPCHTTPYHTIPCHITECHTHAQPYQIIPFYHTLPCHTVHCISFFHPTNYLRPFFYLPLT